MSCITRGGAMAVTACAATSLLLLLFSGAPEIKKTAVAAAKELNMHQKYKGTYPDMYAQQTHCLYCDLEQLASLNLITSASIQPKHKH
jgi:hypothetical protein